VFEEQFERAERTLSRRNVRASSAKGKRNQEEVVTRPAKKARQHGLAG
jgi:hypothetical protein